PVPPMDATAPPVVLPLALPLVALPLLLPPPPGVDCGNTVALPLVAVAPLVVLAPLAPASWPVAPSPKSPITRMPQPASSSAVPIPRRAALMVQAPRGAPWQHSDVDHRSGRGSSRRRCEPRLYRRCSRARRPAGTRRRRRRARARSRQLDIRRRRAPERRPP